MTETIKRLETGDRPLRPQSKPSFEAQLESLPPDVRSVADSLGLRDPDSARRYVAQYIAGKGMK